MKLTIKQKKFADEYIISGNATEAYLSAYAKQSRASAEANARKLLGNYSVRSYIDERLRELDDEAIMKQEEVMKRLTRIGRREESEAVVVTLMEERSEWIDGRKQTIKKEVPKIIEIPAKLSDTNKALELLGKRYAMWTDKIDSSGNMMIVFEDDYGEDPDDS